MSKNNVTIIKTPKMLLPNKSIDMTKWAVIACDQYTSNKSYWDKVEEIVGDAPSTLKITFPEYFLGKVDEAAKVADIQKEERKYLAEGIFDEHPGMILVERKIDNGTRWGLMLLIDLEDYDFTKTSTSWIRATEGTVAERIPPRVKIREGAPLDLPHILVLVDDSEKKLIEPLIAKKDSLKKVYDFDLMLGSGHITGYSLADPAIENQIYDAIAEMQSDAVLEKKYGPVSPKSRILFAIGDGNHSLATAKTIWENHKAEWGMDHPARYALVEIENLHDPAMAFEPIHRVLFGVKGNVTDLFAADPACKVEVKAAADADAMIKEINATPEGMQRFGVVQNGKASIVTFIKAPSVLCVGSVQQILDKWKADGKFEKIDYIHGAEDLVNVAAAENAAGIYLPPVQKNGFFQGIIRDGALPRKTFSMGEAHEKRFYIEAQQIL